MRTRLAYRARKAAERPVDERTLNRIWATYESRLAEQILCGIVGHSWFEKVVLLSDVIDGDPSGNLDERIWAVLKERITP